MAKKKGGGATESGGRSSRYAPKRELSPRRTSLPLFVSHFCGLFEKARPRQTIYKLEIGARASFELHAFAVALEECKPHFLDRFDEHAYLG